MEKSTPIRSLIFEILAIVERESICNITWLAMPAVAVLLIGLLHYLFTTLLKYHQILISSEEIHKSKS